MAGEPKITAKNLSSNLSTILESSFDANEYININHLRVSVAGADARITAQIVKKTPSIAAHVWNSFLIKSNQSADIYALSLEPGDVLKVSSDAAAQIVVQYDSSLVATGGGGGGSGSSGGINPLAQEFALSMYGYVSDNWNISDSTDKYEFATDVRRTWISLNFCRIEGIVLGNRDMAVAIAGYNWRRVGTDRHIYATLVTKVSTAISLDSDDNVDRNLNPFDCASFSNDSNGFVVSGKYYIYAVYEKTHKYNFATESITDSSNVITPRYNHAGCGNSTVGVITGGTISSDTYQQTTTSEKFTYATETYSAGGNIGIAVQGLSACGNAEFGLFAGGVTYPTYEKK